MSDQVTEQDNEPNNVAIINLAIEAGERWDNEEKTGLDDLPVPANPDEAKFGVDLLNAFGQKLKANLIVAAGECAKSVDQDDESALERAVAKVGTIALTAQLIETQAQNIGLLSTMRGMRLDIGESEAA